MSGFWHEKKDGISMTPNATVLRTDTQYPAWKQTILAILRGHDRTAARIAMGGYERPQRKDEEEKDVDDYDPFDPNNNATQEAWQTSNDKAVGFIISKLSHLYTPNFVNYTSARALWLALESRFTITTLTKQMDIVLKLWKINMSNYKNNFEEYASNFSTLVVEHTVTVGNDPKEVIPESIVIMAFLNGLQGFNSFNQTILNLKQKAKFPKLSEVISLCRSDDQARQLSKNNNNSRGEQGKAFTAIGKERCKEHPETRHTNAQCWSQHPELRPSDDSRGSRPKGKGNGKGKGKDDRKGNSALSMDENVVTVAIGESSPTARDQNQAIKASTASPASSSSSSSQECCHAWTRRGLGKDLLQGTAAVVSPVTTALSVSSLSHHWIIDSGANHHLCRDLRMMKRPRPLSPPISVTTGNGTVVCDIQGDVDVVALRESSKCTITLKGVLLIPDLPYNLLSTGLLRSVGKGYFTTKDGTIRSLKDDSIWAHTVTKFNLAFVKTQGLLSAIAGNDDLHLAFPATARTAPSARLLHERMGHAGKSILEKLKSDKHPDMATVDLSQFDFNDCETCHLTKSTKQISRTPVPAASHPFKRLHVDVFGPIKPIGAHPNPDLDPEIRYTLLITDSCTKKRWAFLMTTKGDAYVQLRNHITNSKHRYDEKINVIEIWIDMGKEFGGQYIENFCTHNAIQYKESSAYMPSQNGAAEAANKVIETRARSMMVDSGLPQRMWPDAVKYAVFVTNRTPTARQPDTPNIRFNEAITKMCGDEYRHQSGDDSDISVIRRFGCVAFYNIPAEIRVKASKFAPNSIKGFFVGFQDYSSTNYRVMCPNGVGKWRMRSSPSVTFMEGMVYKQTHDCQDELHSSPPRPANFVQRIMDMEDDSDIEMDPAIEHQLAQQHDHMSIPNFPNRQFPTSSHQNSQGAGDLNTPSTSTRLPVPQETLRGLATQGVQPPGATPPANAENIENGQEFDFSQGIQDDDILQSSPTRESSSPHDNEDDNSNSTPIDPTSTPQDSSSDTAQNEPLAAFSDPFSVEQQRFAGDRVLRTRERKNYKAMAGHQTTTANVAELEQAETAVISETGLTAAGAMSSPPHTPSGGDPLTFKQAMESANSTHWKQAVNDEVQKLKDMGTLMEINTLPPGKSLISGKWVFKTKLHPDNSIDKYKARWVARGFMQRYGVDFNETATATMRSQTGRVILALAAHFNWEIRQVDVVSAFLHGDLHDDVFMKAPEGFSNKPNSIVKVVKSLYGLKQAPMVWMNVLTDALEHLGYISLYMDVCVYTNKDRNVYILVHVDDLQITGHNTAGIHQIIKKLESKFEIKHVNSSLYLGIQIERCEHVLRLHQSHYTTRILEQFGYTHCHSMSTPSEASVPLKNTTEGESKEHNPRKQLYQEAIGSLMYLANQTRPDIAFAVNMLSRFSSNPSSEHWNRVTRIFRYLAGTVEYGITYGKGKQPFNFAAYCDADYAGDKNTTKSTTGYVLFVNGGPIVWKSRLQNSVTNSSTEAEYDALAEGIKDIKWLQNLMGELHIDSASLRPLVVFEDNQSTIKLAKNHLNHRRCKHIDVKNHYARQEQKRGNIDVQYIPTDQQAADGFTKPLERVKFVRFLGMLGVTETI